MIVLAFKREVVAAVYTLVVSDVIFLYMVVLLNFGLRSVSFI